MKPEQAVSDLEDELRRDPRNLAVRLRLAAALREAGRDGDAVSHYQVLARAYRSSGELRQAMAACHSALSIDPSHAAIRILLAQLQAEDLQAPAKVEVRPPGIRSKPPGSVDMPAPRTATPAPAPARQPAPTPAPAPAPLPAPARAFDPGRTFTGPPPAPPRTGVSGKAISAAGSGSELAFEAEPAEASDPSAVRPGFDQFLSAEDAALDIDTPPVDPSDEEMARPTTELKVPASLRGSAPWDDEAEQASDGERDADEDDDDDEDSAASLTFAGPLAAADPLEEEFDVTQPSADHPVIEMDADEPGTHSRQRAESPAVSGSVVVDAGLELARAFDRSFAEALDRLRDGDRSLRAAAPFPGLSEQAMAELSRGLERRQIARGDIILREGEPGDACFVIIAGEVRVLKRDPVDPRADLIEVAQLREGEMFGEFALLADRRRHATVQAVQECDLYVISRRLLRRLADRYPEVGPELERFYRQRLLHTLMATASFFAPLKPDRRQRLLSRFRSEKIESGDAIVREGTEGGGFYLIVLGSVEIIKQVSKHQTVLLASLGEGAYFGELSLLRGDVARATVRATGPVELAVLAPRDFYDVVADNPVLWDQVRQVAHQRELETCEIVAGVTSSV